MLDSIDRGARRAHGTGDMGEAESARAQSTAPIVMGVSRSYWLEGRGVSHMRKTGNSPQMLWVPARPDLLK